MVIKIGPGTTQQLIRLADISPTAQRLVIGATGLLSQTTIDALNPYVDAKTRKYSAVRTAVKMVICTASGLLTRVVGQKLGEFMVNTGKIAVPQGVPKAVFSSSIGKVFAILGATASIFLIDVPFINKILNVVMNKFFKNKDSGDVVTNKKQVNVNA